MGMPPTYGLSVESTRARLEEPFGGGGGEDVDYVEEFAIGGAVEPGKFVDRTASRPRFNRRGDSELLGVRSEIEFERPGAPVLLDEVPVAVRDRLRV